VADVGFIGWRGMVGSVLLQRMREEHDLDGLDVTFFSSSQAGGAGPDIGKGKTTLQNASDIEALAKHSILISCQGGDYTKEIYPQLKERGWNGYWIDAASAKRMDADSLIVLTPVNGDKIEEGLRSGIRNLIGGNCTVSLMLMAINELYKQNLIERLSVMSYQAYSGAGAKLLQAYISQMSKMVHTLESMNSKPPAEWNVLELDAAVTRLLNSPEYLGEGGFPLVSNLAPWIDKAVNDGSGQTREEWKGAAETSKILGSSKQVLVDGICTRVGAMRCHSQGITMDLNKEIEVAELEKLLAKSTPWTKVVPNDEKSTKSQLTPVALSGSLEIHVGRIRQLYGKGSKTYGLFTVGDQLLWGAAEPLRYALNHVLAHLGQKKKAA
jgi:aspartate-semialdehyde dehydrogenase